MPSETAVSRQIAGKAIYAALAKAEFAPSRILPWEELDQEERESWCAAGEDMLLEIGLTALAEDILGEREAVNAGIVEVGGHKYMRDIKGRLVPLELVKPADKLEDEMVRKVMAFALDLSAQVARFKDHTYADLNGFQQLHEQDYGARAGGAKGNATFQTVDGLMQIRLQVADVIKFGSQLQQAKNLIDECLVEWGHDARPEIRAIVTSAFSVEREGQINKANLFLLLKLDIADERWIKAMKAIRDAIRPDGTKEYVRFYKRDRPQDRFEAITIALSAA